MGTLFYMHEVVTFALEREQESYDLYKALAEKVARQEMKTIFQRLMQEEQRHKTYYAELLAAVPAQRTPGVAAGEEYEAYLRTLLEERRTAKIPPPDLDNLREVLDFAIAREKDAVLFYVGLQNYVPEKDQPTVKTIIQEEGWHIVQLTEIKKKFA